MIFYTVPKTDESTYQNESMLPLQMALREQLETITSLNSLAQYLKGSQHLGIDAKDSQNYSYKVERISSQQKERFKLIDTLINENILALKKRKTSDRTIFVYGKEVRKIEAGIRTLALFVLDVIKMLKQNDYESSAVKNRLSYFEKRAVSLETEIKTLQLKLAQL